MIAIMNKNMLDAKQEAREIYNKCFNKIGGTTLKKKHKHTFQLSMFMAERLLSISTTKLLYTRYENVINELKLIEQIPITEV